MVDKEKDWEKEMAEVDRLLKKLPYGEPTPSVGSAPTVRNTPAVAPPGADLTAAGQWLGTWARVVLGLLIGIGMTQWPYTHGCGLRLIVYLVGVGGGAAWLRAATFEEFKQAAERAFLLGKLQEHDWNVSETARTLQMPRSNLYKKIERYRLARGGEGGGAA